MKARGKKLSDSGAKARLYHAVKDARLANIIRVDLKNERFAYEIDHDALALAQLMDGKLLLVTNTPDLAKLYVLLDGDVMSPGTMGIAVKVGASVEHKDYTVDAERSGFGFGRLRSW